MKNLELNAANCPYFFLESRDENEGEILVAKKEWFETKSIGDCYDSNGQPIDTEEVGDYEVEVYNYHDGSNFQSIVLDSPADEDIDFDIVKDEAQILEMWQAVETKSYVQNKNGYTYYESGNFNLTQSHWQGSWALFTITEK